MAKTLSVAVLFLLILSMFASCKKCYTCTNTCTQCLKTDSAGTLSKTIYSDSLSYATALTALKDSGYTCANIKPTYSINFCVNTKDAESQYLPYYEGDGRYTCSPK